jgi:hypothetical protein
MDVQREFDELVGGAAPGLTALLGIYEPLESAYRTATSPVECFTESSNTNTTPRAITHVSTNVR